MTSIRARGSRGAGAMASATRLSASGLAVIADGEDLPHVPRRLVPVHEAAALVRIDLHVHRTVGHAPVGDAARLDATQDGIELGIADAEAIVQRGEGPFRLIEVQRQAIAHVHGAERTYALFRPGNIEQTGQQLRGRALVVGGNDRVVEVNGHAGLRLKAPAPPADILTIGGDLFKKRTTGTPCVISDADAPPARARPPKPA